MALITGAIYGDAVGERYVKALWFESISSGTSGTLTPPTGGTIVLNQWAAGVDALASQISSSIPTFESPLTSGGVVITATLSADGAWTLSGTPSSYPVAIIYCYQVRFKDFDYTKQLGGYELIPTAAGVSTDVSAFDGILASTDSTVQKALDTIDGHSHANDHTRKHTVTSTDDHTFPGGTTFLKADGTFATPAGTVAGSDTQVQFNDGGSAFGGDSGFTYNKTTDTASVGAVNIASVASVTEKAEVNGALAVSNASTNWGAGAERGMIDYAGHYTRVVGAHGGTGSPNLGIKLAPQNTETHIFSGTGEKTTVDQYICHANYPSLGLNVYYASGWKLGAGTAKYGGYIWFDQTAGTLDIYSTEATANADAAVTPLLQCSIGLGLALFPRISTTASAANAFLDSTSSNSLLRSTSSLKYKDDIQDVTNCDIIYKLRPVTFKSKCKADDPEQTFYGFIAEEVSEFAPEFVFYNEDKKPDGVQYDRLIVPLVACVKELRGRIEELEKEKKQ